MSHQKYQSMPFLFFIFLVSSVLAHSGCDKISAFTERFQSKGPSASPVSAVQQPAAAPAVNTADPAKVPSKPTANTLVQIGAWSLTIDEFKERLTALKQVVPDYDENDPQAKRFVLDELVRQELLVQDAERKGVDQKKEIKNAVDEFRRTLLVREMATQLTQNIQATEEEARAYYDENKADFISPGRWHLREMVFSTEEAAKNALIELYKGADFAALAQEQSISESKANGGDLGFVDAFDFPQLENVVRTLEVGGVSSVFKGPQGFYVVKLEELEGAEPQPYEPIKEEIKTGLMMLKQQQAILQYLEDLQSRADIYINEKLLGD